MMTMITMMMVMMRTMTRLVQSTTLHEYDDNDYNDDGDDGDDEVVGVEHHLLHAGLLQGGELRQVLGHRLWDHYYHYYYLSLLLLLLLFSYYHYYCLVVLGSVLHVSLHPQDPVEEAETTVGRLRRVLGWIFNWSHVCHSACQGVQLHPIDLLEHQKL